jgi:hypothetical protein
MGGHVACMGKMKDVERVWAENLKGRDLVISGRVILKWFLKKYGVRMWTGFIWLRIRSSGRLL